MRDLDLSFWLPPSSSACLLSLGVSLGEKNPGLPESTEDRQDSPCFFLGSFLFQLLLSAVVFLARCGVPGGSHLRHQSPWPRADGIGWQLISGNRGPPMPSQSGGLWQLLDSNCCYPCRLYKSIGQSAPDRCCSKPNVLLYFL